MSQERALASYVATVVALALAGLAYDVTSSGRHWFGPSPAAFWLLAGCGLVSELIPLRWLAYDNRGEVTGSWTFVMAMMLIASPLAAVIVTAGLFALSDIKSGKKVIKLTFNVADIVLSLSLGALILGATGQASALQTGRAPDLLWFPVAAAAFVVVFAANTLLTCGVIALSARIPLRSVVRDHGTDAMPTDVMLLALAPIFVVTAERSLLLVPPLLVTTAIVYRTAQLALRRRHEATHDLLTGLANRRLFDQELERALAATVARKEQLALVLIDLDGFKAINDNLGHQVGDLVLREVSHRLTSACRGGELVARLGGDEFAIVMSRVGSIEAATAATLKVLDEFENAIEIDGLPVSLKASAGVAIAPEHGLDASTLFSRADEAMYAAKSARSGLHVHRPGPVATAIGRLGLLSDLSWALETSALFLEYQPQVCLDDGSPIGFEALIRWQHPTVGVVPPAVFMPLAEQTELIGPITTWVLAEALKQLSIWLAEGRDLTMAVNVSVRNLEDRHFPRTVERKLAEAGVDPTRLVIELTENTAALDRATVREVLQELRDLGIGVAIDDFGTGYSSIVQLRDLPVDQIKLDRRFVDTMADDSRDALIVRAIIHLANALGVQTVAEGVEQELVASLLRDLGCQKAQGFLFARPLPADAADSWLARRDRWQIPAIMPEGSVAAPEA
jgi:diguanylate cyclase (GGDEF)-like protein